MGIFWLYFFDSGRLLLTLNLLTTTIVAPPSNASKWQMGFNSAFKRLTCSYEHSNEILGPIVARNFLNS